MNLPSSRDVLPALILEDFGKGIGVKGGWKHRKLADPVGIPPGSIGYRIEPNSGTEPGDPNWRIAKFRLVRETGRTVWVIRIGTVRESGEIRITKPWCLSPTAREALDEHFAYLRGEVIQAKKALARAKEEAVLFHEFRQDAIDMGEEEQDCSGASDGGQH